MELQCHHLYHPASRPLVNIQATFSEGLTCIQNDGGGDKQALLRLLTAEERAEQGCITFLGYDIIRLGKAYQNHLSHPAQFSQQPSRQPLFHYLMQNALCQRLSAKAARQKAELVLRELGAPELSSQPVQALPPALRQRLYLLQALYSEAPVLILDEPFRLLGPGERRHIEDILAQYLEEKIILVFTQRKDPFPGLPCQFYSLRRGRLETGASRPYSLR